MAKYFLAKTDPDTYSISDFQKEKETFWDGVRNYTAIIAIKSWQIGDYVFIYHSQGENAIVGLSKVMTKPVPDPNDAKQISWYAKLKLIEVYPKDKWVTLKEIKGSGLFQDFQLVKNSRLSTMPCPENFVNWLAAKGLNVGDE
jgi:predicted RNA-binding protein with PUA-like domain